VRNNEFDSSKAIEELGYNPRPIAQSIAEEIDWVIKEGIVTLHEPKEPACSVTDSPLALHLKRPGKKSAA
jgi:dihydroflavonol-4-reductase